MAKLINPGDWKAYFKATQNLEPHDFVVNAVQHFERERANSLMAVDLGAGAGRDTRHLLEQGWRVTAIDCEIRSVEILRQIGTLYPGKLSAVCGEFTDVELPSATLVCASYSLPFCGAAVFPTLWSKIEMALVPGGRFAGHFFGKEDEWSNYEDVLTHSKEEITELLRNFSIEMFKETKEVRPTADGTNKFWHLYTIIAKKR